MAGRWFADEMPIIVGLQARVSQTKTGDRSQGPENYLPTGPSSSDLAHISGSRPNRLAALRICQGEHEAYAEHIVGWS